MFRFWPAIIKPLLDAAQARSIIEIGSGQGRNSVNLARWAREHGAQVHLVDPEPDFDLERLAQRFAGHCSALRAPSLDALPTLPRADVVLIDGDHNWYTVFHELQEVLGRVEQPRDDAPICICHDVEWPYGRRDLYYVLDRIPHEYRQSPSIGGLQPGEQGLVPDGMSAEYCHAALEGGPRNGVRTAIEDALQGREADFRVLWIPVLFGLAVIVPLSRIARTPALTHVLDALELSPQARALMRMVELERVVGLIALARS
jgi:hypothetical protein